MEVLTNEKSLTNKEPQFTKDADMEQPIETQDIFDFLTKNMSQRLSTCFENSEDDMQIIENVSMKPRLHLPESGKVVEVPTNDEPRTHRELEAAARDAEADEVTQLSKGIYSLFFGSNIR